MIAFPNFKINIGLQILGKRPDGYHDLETMMYPVDFLKDKIELSELDNRVEIEVNNVAIPGSVEENLCVKAFRVLQKEYDLKGINIKLFKNIPMGAGLGGGSSDAAFTLKMLDSYYNLQISKEKMVEYALKLGSDVPFFIENLPAIGRGRGEALEPVELDLSDYSITVIKPLFSISTAEAYATVKPSSRNVKLKEALQLPVKEWKKYIYNDFEQALFVKYPLLQEIKDTCYRLGATYASLSGSGSAMYAISDAKLELERHLPVSAIEGIYRDDEP